MDTVKPPGKPLLEIRDLRTHFVTRAGVVKAVNGVSFSVMPGETPHTRSAGANARASSSVAC